MSITWTSASITRVPGGEGPPGAIVPLQSLIPGTGVGSRALYTDSNGVLWYATKEQSPFPGGPNDFCVFKSLDGIAWEFKGSHFVSDNQNAAIIFANDILYLGDYFAFGPPFPAVICSVDLTGGGGISFVDSSHGPDVDFTDQSQTLSVSNDGTVLYVFTDPNGHFKSVVYTPGSDSWSAPIQIDAGPAFPVAQIHDTALDKTFVFYRDNSNNLLCVTLDAGGNVLGTSGILQHFGVAPTSQVFGLPVITKNSPSGNPSVLLPYKIGGPPTIKGAWIDTGTLATTVEVIEDATTLPPGDQIQAYSQTAVPGWAAFDFNNTVYVAYTVDNGDNNDPTSQSFLYLRDRSAGAWSASTVIYTSAIPREMVTPFPATLFNSPAIVFNLFDPTIGVASTDALSTIILYSASGPPPPPATPSNLVNVSFGLGGAFNGGGRGPCVLPDPNLICGLEGQMRCVFVDGVKNK